MSRCVAVLLALALVTAVGCDDPDYQEGIPCSEADTCPPGQVCDAFDRRCRVMPLPVECRQDPDCASGACDQGAGVCLDACRPDTCAAGPCETARCEGDMCVVEPLCGDGETCCGGACVAAGCDDGDPCTADSCGAQGCEHTPASGAACDDGVHCNGADTCMEGVCQAHAGDPCGSPTVCDEGAGACVGCLDDNDCPAAEDGEWGACGGFADVCDASGVASRTVTAYTCQERVCVSQTTTEDEACDRVTEGATCGAVMSGPWTSCSGFEGTCDESGTRSREVITRACASEVCTAVSATEEQACGRDTDGVSCDDPVHGAWGACGGFVGECGEAGTRSRAVTTFACADESCAGISESETEACERDTDGDAWGTGVTCGSWSACGSFSGTCDETGTRTRQCTRSECANGGCSTASFTETGNCSRDTDGNTCSNRSCGAWGTCTGFSNTCDETGTQSRTCTTSTCSNSACTGTITDTETRGCNRNTDGDTCGGTSCGSWGLCFPNQGGQCGPGTRARTCQTEVCESADCDALESSTQTQSCTVQCSGNQYCTPWGACCHSGTSCIPD